MKKLLPIGIQSFEKIRQGNYYYVDKTEYIYKLVSSGCGYYFLSRPRRFGKSLLIDTIKQAFLGRKELFAGLYLENNWDWSVKYPVIHISFGLASIKNSIELEKFIWSVFNEIEEVEGIEGKAIEELIERRFYKIIKELYKKYQQKVVVLVDEYDKPILDVITDRELAQKVRDILKGLYTVLKDTDKMLNFVMLTGVSKFSKVSLFSGLNQLKDITLDKNYATICGYTEKELEEVFAPELEGVDIEEIREWYNGYSFCGERVYNPFDILLYFSERQYKAYWFETGTPDFLIRLLMKGCYYIPQLEEVVVTERLLGSFDVDKIEPEALLFQTGYLTIKEWKSSPRGMMYKLSYPNREVKVSLNESILSYYSPKEMSDVIKINEEIREKLVIGELEGISRLLARIFEGIPSEWYRKNDLEGYEGYYCSVLYSMLVSSGLRVIAEDVTSRGRIDLTVVVGGKVYVIEVKVLEEGEEVGKAIKQIEEKGYYRKYLGSSQEVYIVGIEFSKSKRNIVNMEYKKVS